MMMLAKGLDQPIIIVLSDDSEIEIKVIELNGNKPKIVISSSQAVCVVQESLVDTV